MLQRRKRAELKARFSKTPSRMSFSLILHSSGTDANTALMLANCTQNAGEEEEGISDGLAQERE